MSIYQQIKIKVIVKYFCCAFIFRLSQLQQRQQDDWKRRIGKSAEGGGVAAMAAEFGQVRKYSSILRAVVFFILRFQKINNFTYLLAMKERFDWFHV